MEDTNQDVEHTNADKDGLLAERFSATWARLAYKNLVRFELDHLVDLEQFGSSVERLFLEPQVRLDAWMHLNTIGVEKVANWEVEIARTVSHSTHTECDKLLQIASTPKDAIELLAAVAPRIDPAVEVECIEDDSRMWLHVNYPNLEADLLPVWCPSSCKIAYSVAISAMGYTPDCKIGFTFPSVSERRLCRPTHYAELFHRTVDLNFGCTESLVPLRGYYICFDLKDLQGPNVLYETEDQSDTPYELTTADRVKAALRTKMKKSSAKQIAARLGISDRELRRKLSLEGLQFQDLHDRHLLLMYSSPKLQQMSLAKAASVLGYGSGQSLKRALESAKR